MRSGSESWCLVNNAFLGNRAPAKEVGLQRYCKLCYKGGRGKVPVNEEHLLLVCPQMADVRDTAGLDFILRRFGWGQGQPLKSVMCKMFTFYNICFYYALWFAPDLYHKYLSVFTFYLHFLVSFCPSSSLPFHFSASSFPLSYLINGGLLRKKDSRATLLRGFA